MQPKHLSGPPRFDIIDYTVPILANYPHPGRLPESVREANLAQGKGRYVFHDFVKWPRSCMRDLKREYPLPGCVLRSFGDVDSIFYYIGKAGTGTTLHRHDSALNILSHGRKRWLMFPPTQHNKSLVERLGAGWNDSRGETVMKWERKFKKEILEKGEHVYDFYQNSQQMLWIPKNWFHEVKNESDVRGIVFAFC